MPYIGKNPVGGGFHKLDALTASATATYALTLNSTAYYPESANQLLVSLNGVIQAPQDSFTVSGSNLVFDTALTASDSIDFVVALGDVLAVKTVTDGAITTAKLGNGAVTSAKLDTNIAVSGNLDVGTIRDASGTNTAMTIDSSGILTAPKVPAFSAKLSSNWTTDNATVVYDTEIFDNGNNYSTTTGLFTAPVAGVYFFTTQGARYYNDPTGDYYLYLLQEGSIKIGFLQTHITGQFTNTGGSFALDLALGDEVGIRWQAAGSGNKTLYGTGDNAASFSGYLIG